MLWLCQPRASDARLPACQVPVLEALHARADNLGGRFKAMNGAGRMGKIKLGKPRGSADAAAAAVARAQKR